LSQENSLMVGIDPKRTSRADPMLTADRIQRKLTIRRDMVDTA
jgi:hypothetical protein